MQTKRPPRLTDVRGHPRKVPPSKKNPQGVTIVDQHKRRVPGSSLCRDEVLDVAKNYDIKSVKMPSAGRLSDFSRADDYDKTIGTWTDYFNKKFASANPLDPDTVKALIASESGFNPDARSGVAYGLTQITKQTLKILQDVEGEAKDFTFCKMRLKDLDNPDLAIPMAIRWLFKKKEMAERKLKREATHEDIIIEYKRIMQNLKRNKLVCLIFLTLISGCSTPPTFKLKQSPSGSAYELRTSPDRVITECERVEKDDGTILYALSAQVLDDRKRVISLTHFLLLLEKDCNKNRERVSKILRNGKDIYLAGRGDLSDIDKMTEFKHNFPGHGTFNGSATVMDFFAIANEKGDCFSPLQMAGKKCLSYPFPLK